MDELVEQPTVQILQAHLNGALEQVRTGIPVVLAIDVAFHNEFSTVFDKIALQGDMNDFIIHRYSLKREIDHLPYAPFLQTLAVEEPQEISDLINRSEIYQPHRSLFQAYFSGKQLNQSSSLLLEDLFYSQWNLRQDILKLVATSSRTHPAIVVIDNIQNAPLSTFSFLEHVLTQSIEGKLLIVVVGSTHHSSLSDQRAEALAHFWRVLQQHQCTIELDIKLSPAERINSHIAHWNSTSDIPSDPVELLDTVKQLLHFLDPRTGLVISQELLARKVVQDDTPFYIDTMLTASRCAYYARDFDFGIDTALDCIEFCYAENDLPALAGTYALAANLYLEKHDLTRADHAAEQSIKYALEHGDEQLIASAIFSKFLVNDRLTLPIDEKLYVQLLDLLEKHKMESELSFVLKNAYIYYDFYGSWKEVLKQTNRALDLAKKAQNDHALAADYHKLSIIHARQNNFELSLDNLQKSADLRLSLNDPLDIVRSFNGLGYLYMQHGDFEKANDSYHQAFHYLSQVKSYSEIGATLFNYANLLFFSGNYASACSVVDQLLEIMAILHLTYIPFQSYDDILAFRAAAYALSNNGIFARTVLDRIDTPDSELKERSIFLKKLAEAILYCEKENWCEAKIAFKHSIDSLNLENLDSCWVAPVCYYNVVKRFANIDELFYLTNIENAINLCERNNISYWLSAFRKLENDNEVFEWLELPLQLDLNAIRELAKCDEQSNRLARKTNEFRLLHSFQSQLINIHSKDKTLEHITSFIKHQFDYSHIIFGTVVNDQWTLLSSSGFEDQQDDELVSILLNLSSKAEIQLLSAADIVDFEALTGKTGQKVITIPIFQDSGLSGLLVAATQRMNVRVSADDIDFLKVVIHEAMSMLYKVEKDEALRIAKQELQYTNDNLESLVADRTEQLENALKELSDKHEELQSVQLQLIQQEKMSSLGTLVAGVAHEINNPANFVGVGISNSANKLAEFKAYLNELIDDDIDDYITDSIESHFKNIEGQLNVSKDGIRRISEIVKDLRTFGKTDPTNEMQKTDIVANINATLALIKGSYKSTIQFHIDLNTRPMLLCYPSRLNQVFMNLLINACHAVELKDDGEKGSVWITTSQDNDSFIFTVKDNGPGIPAKLLQKIYEPFFTTKEKGTGLGLAISFKIIQDHGGNIEVSSSESDGTTFVVRIPGVI